MSIAVNQQRVRAARLNNGQIRRVYTNNAPVFEQAGNLPVIQAFSVAPESQNRSTFATGDQITLAWAATGATAVSGRPSQKLYETLQNGNRTEISISDTATTLRFRRPSQTAVYTLEQYNANGYVDAQAKFSVVADTQVRYFREQAGSFLQGALASGGVIGSVVLEWEISGEPEPTVIVTGDGKTFVNSTIRPYRTHTTFRGSPLVGIGEVRVSRVLLPRVAAVTYTLTINNGATTSSAQATIRWPQ